MTDIDDSMDTPMDHALEAGRTLADKVFVALVDSVPDEDREDAAISLAASTFLGVADGLGICPICAAREIMTSILEQYPDHGPTQH